MSHILNTLVHLVNLVIYSFTLYSMSILHIPFLENKFSKFNPGQCKYLTIWDVAATSQVDSFCRQHMYPQTFNKNEYRTIAYRQSQNSLLVNSGEMREGLAIGFHAVTFLQYAFAVFYDYTYTIVPHNVTSVHNAYGGKFKFLTFWDAILQAIFFLICLLNDLFGTNAINPKKPPFTRKLKDYFHASLGFPVAMFVGVTFWALMFVDRELVLPKALDPYFPSWLNHLMHTMIMVTTVLEMIVAPRQYPKRLRGLGLLIGFMLVYLVWIHIIYYKSGVWVYPVMDVLTPPLQMVFFAVLLTFCTSLYFIGEMLNNIIWGNEYTKHKKSHAKSK